MRKGSLPLDKRAKIGYNEGDVFIREDENISDYPFFRRKP